MEAKQIKRLSVLGLLLIFASPILVSWWLLNYTDYSRNDAAASHGDLIVPPRTLENINLIELAKQSKQQHSLHGKWSLVYLNEGMCDKDCGDNLYKMRQLRLAAGEFAPRIQRVLVVIDSVASPLSDEMLQHFSGQLLLHAEQHEQMSSLKIFARMKDENPVTERRLYLIDPLGNLMMSYPPDTEPAGIIKDLKRLLRYSRIG
jgi:cytochrome oxidase Cu insertion factor (SCO1/SenC/PrrC family)